MKTNELKLEFDYSEKKDLALTKVTNKDIDENTQDNLLIEVDDIETVPDIIKDIDIYHDTSRKFASTWETKVLSIGNWPEFKSKTCYKWVRIPLDGRTKVPYPCVWRRTCNKAWYLRIVYSGSSSLPTNIEQIIKECSKVALIPSLPILLTGNVGGAISAFLAIFKPCLIEKGVKEAAKFSIGFVSKKTCSKWKRI